MSSLNSVSFWNFISSKNITKIKIPKIQRDYVQGRNSKKIAFSLNRLLQDLYAAVFNKKSVDLNYVYGKIDSNGVFIPIDGQQRLTTLLTLHVYAFAMEDMQSELKVLKDKFAYETRTTTGRFLDLLIANISKFFTDGGKNISVFIKDEPWFTPSWIRDPSVISFLCVLDKIEETFGKNKFASKLTSHDCPITYMHLSIDNMGDENDLYVKMNSRGKPLTELEIFKSEMFDYIDALARDNVIKDEFGKNFKLSADTKWMNMIWDICERPEAECDNRYMNLLHYVIMNHLQNALGNKSDLKDIIENKNKGFYNFSLYKEKMNDSVAIDKINATFNLLDLLRVDAKDVFAKIKNDIIIKLEADYRRERVILFAITKYALDLDGHWDVSAFESWYRIVVNLVRNTEIDKEDKYYWACGAINKLPSDCLQNPIDYFVAMPSDKPTVDFFARNQIEEEILKAKLIKKNSDWLKPITEAEGHGYFRQQIGFMFGLQNIDQNNIRGTQTDIDEFNENWKIVKELFGEKVLKNDDNNIFRRALLTFGNYSMWANSNKTFFFEGGNEYYNWQRMLREPQSFAIFKRLFEKVKSEKPKSAQSVMNDLIDKYTSNDEFLYNLVKVPALFEYMRENRYIKRNERNDKRTVIYHKARLSADYAEALSYAVMKLLEVDKHKVEYRYGTGYLEYPTSFAYIDKIDGKDMKIEVKDGIFYLSGVAMHKSDGTEVKKVVDAVAYIMNRL